MQPLPRRHRMDGQGFEDFVDSARSKQGAELDHLNPAVTPLGDAAAWPVAAAIRHFRHEFEWHIRNPREATQPGAVYRGSELVLA